MQCAAADRAEGRAGGRLPVRPWMGKADGLYALFPFESRMDRTINLHQCGFELDYPSSRLRTYRFFML